MKLSHRRLWISCIYRFAYLIANIYIIWLSHLVTLSVYDEGYSWNAPCALIWISMFLLHASPLCCMTWLSVTEYLCHKWTPICTQSQSGPLPIHEISPGFVTRATLRVQLVEKELPTLPEHLNLPSVLVRFLLFDH